MSGDGGEGSKGPFRSLIDKIAGVARSLGERYPLSASTFKKPIVITGIVAVIAGFGGGYVIGHGGRATVIDATSSAARGTAASQPQGFVWPFFGRPRSANAPRAGQPKPEGFTVWRQHVDTSGSEPKACIQMTRPLDPARSYADFVLLDPNNGAAPAVSVHDDELCLGGLGFADRRITLLKGLPAKGRETLAENVDVDFKFGEQAPFVGFAGDGVILPREEADGIGIVSINVAKLDVEVWRVPDRNLVRKDIVVTDPASQGDYMGSWGDDYPADEGQKIWSGEVPVANRPGERVTTVFPLGAVLKEMQPGGYIIVARDAAGAAQDKEQDYGALHAATARRWVIFTDMALMSYTGSDGLDAVVRSISSAKALAAIKVALVAADGETLAETTTDVNGRVRFARPLLEGKEGQRAKMLMAYGAQGDLAVLDLDRSPVDLSRQGVGGRAEQDLNLTAGRQADTVVDGYIYADRGIYRPGETAHLVALVRDRAARAVTDRAGELVVYRPSGVEFGRYRFGAAADGFVAKDVTLPRSAPRGRWRAELKMDGLERPSGAMSFSVEDFAPQRLAVDIDANKDQPVASGETRAVNVQARFLYGAAGAGLQTQGEARIAYDPNPFPDFKDYRWGDQQDPFAEQALDLNSTVTDGAGHAVFTIASDLAGETPSPLKAVVTASVFEPGGRPVRESVFLKVRPKPVYLGVKINETETRGRDNPVDFDIIAVNGEGRRIAAQGVTWTLIRENWDYNWYQQNGRWQWRRTSRDVVAAKGAGAISAAKGLAFRKSLNWGDYRIEIEGPDGSRTVIKFAAGWGAPAGDDQAPDLVRVSGDGKDHVQGDVVEVAIKAPYAGEAQIAIATDHIIEIRNVTIGADGDTVRLRTSADWGGGAYVMVTLIQPRNPTSVPTPRRAMGVTYISLAPGDRKLAVDIGTPEKLDSRADVVVPLKVSGTGLTERAHVTVAAVDEGILRLTGFDSPDPVDWYFGKRALGVDYRDDYGRLLDPNLGAPANINFGGDEIGGEGLTATPIKTVALWSGVVETGLDGKATVKLPAALFNGQLRLMAVAWTDDAVGGGAKDMTVREAVVADLNLPRFLAPGDHAVATLELHNLEGKAGTYTAEVNGKGGILLRFRQMIALALGQRVVLPAPLDGPNRAGIGQVDMSVSGPDFSTSKSYPLQTRLGWGQSVQTWTEQQQPGTTFTPPNALLNGVTPGSATMYISYSPFRGFDPAAVALALGGYKYGCSEQIVSTAYPLLYSDRLDQGDAPVSNPALDNAVQQLLGRQSLDGAFGLWAVGDGEADPWLGAYVTDFLIEAKKRGANVPQPAIDLALSAMRQIAQPDSWSPVAYRLSYERYWQSNDKLRRAMTERMRSRASAYALYVMAKGGQGDLARLRWWHDVQMKNDPSPVARAQVAAGLAMMGDKARAHSAIRAAVQALGYREESDWYQSPLRDLAAVITYAYGAGEPDLAQSLQGRLEGAVRDPDSLNTQEEARLLQAAHAMLKAAGPMKVTASGAGAIDIPDIAGQPRWGVGLLSASHFTNAGTGPLWRTVTLRATPTTSPDPRSNGIVLSKTLFSPSGARVDPSSITQGDRILVRITGVSRQGRTMLAVIDDALPAGWEVEAVLGPDDAQDGPYKFLGKLSNANVQERRDDRYVAALDVPGNETFTVAYVARAVTPGNFYLPGATAEDMYRPEINARTAGARAVITPRP